jgi:hypothetical protein
MADPSTQLTATALRGRRPRRRWNDEVIAVVTSVCVALAAGLLMMAAEPTRVDRLSITNPSEYQIRIRAGNSTLTDVEAGTSRQYQDIFDQGQRWVFAFASQSVEAGTIEIDRAVLADNDWTVVIPENVIEALRAAPIEPATTRDSGG